MKHVAGIFANRFEADAALAELEAKGFSHDCMSLLITDDARRSLFSKTDDEAERAAKGGAAGALTVGALGALLVGLTVITGIAVPGVGLLAAGPLVGMLTAGTAGAAVGGIGGALIASGFAADEANRYEEEIKAGRAVVIIHADSTEELAAARAALDAAGAAPRAA